MASPYAMTLSLNVLNHLGINLYSNVPAVISEVVANAYDADAEKVEITLDSHSKSITIRDDGCGMTTEDVNSRFLHVGYRRRESDQAITPRFGRKVMGRKGIGKLSLFSIARVVEVYTIKDGQRSAFRMQLDEIQRQISNTNSGQYHPESLIDQFPGDLHRGTKIVLTDLKKELQNVASGLTKRIARRFSILGSEYNFRVLIGGREVTAVDRDYFHKAQFLWVYDEFSEAEKIGEQCKRAENKKFSEPATLPEGEVRGWIATSFSPKDLKDDDGEQINRVTLMVRGKLAHENLLEEIKESSIFGSYLFGEIHADFLDSDDAEDIATSSRQRIVEDDPRYQSLIQWFTTQVRAIGSAWTDLRNQKGTSAALENLHIKAWFNTLRGDTKKKAVRLFGKINQLTVDNPQQRAQLFAHSVLAFEVMRYRENLDALDQLETSDLQSISILFGNIEDLEAVLYHRIVTQRLKVIEKLQQHVDNDSLEKVLQEHLFSNLWLLDPSWERATDHTMEERVGRAFSEISADLTPEERASRIDIRYKRMAGAHVIVELKRHSASTSTLRLYEQVDKYREALSAFLRNSGKDERVECVCVLGKDPSDWSKVGGREKSAETLKAINTRIVKYDELLTNAYDSYREYLDQEEKTSDLRKILESLAEDAGEN
ncbi:MULTISPECIES: ATP-binding protein [Amycolatopsis]|uniref:BbrUII/HgiDII family restriction enzyme n=1 Tax=Amycolatopsis TaxID=1813 RepID=UPI000B8AFF96|nr:MULTISPECIES: ATP-binding protein [Amycolatopsis]OXM73355.1 hypothetical protein CF166_10485 [Amycolatopsis sp. KNN50.9b]